MLRKSAGIVTAAVIAVFIWMPSSHARASNPKLGRYYLALGDSFGVGVMYLGESADTGCKTSHETNFVCIFYRYLKRLTPALQVLNLSESFFVTCEIAKTQACAGGAKQSMQLGTATKFLSAHPGEVSPITLSLGSGDLAAYVHALARTVSGEADTVKISTSFRVALDAILGQLRSVSPDALIIVTTQPVPFVDTLPAEVSAEEAHLAQGLAMILNGVVREEAPKYDAVVSDCAQAFEQDTRPGRLLTYPPLPAPGSGTGGLSIVPTARGDEVFATRLIADSGFSLPLTLRLRISQPRAKRNSTNAVVGTSSPAAQIVAKIVLPGDKRRTARATADSSGHFVARFNVEGRRGTVRVRVCATDSAQDTLCRPVLTFTIR